jgi:hypothetical protein
MTAALVKATALAVAATVALAIVASVMPARRPLAVGVYLLVLGGLGVRLLLAWLRLAYPPPPPSPFDTALAARPAAPRPPAELERLARLLALSNASALHAHTRLRPELRPVAADRLRWSLAVDLDTDPAARAALGEAGWALLGPDPRGLPDREAPGLPPEALAEVIVHLERIGAPEPRRGPPR